MSRTRVSGSTIRATVRNVNHCNACSNANGDSAPVYVSETIHQLFVLVPGTTAPINTPMAFDDLMFANWDTWQTSHSIPQTADESYWTLHEPVRYVTYGTNNNPINNTAGISEFLDCLNQVKANAEQFSHSTHGLVKLVKNFSWDGFNNKGRREQAGRHLAQLIERECSEWINHRVWIHLIGHSHGGNVINECINSDEITELFSQQTKFQFKSVTYLSTPFFKNMHVPIKNINGTKIINVFNEFDLTQRVIADFSVYESEKNDLYYVAAGLVVALKKILGKESFKRSLSTFKTNLGIVFGSVSIPNYAVNELVRSEINLLGELYEIIGELRDNYHRLFQNRGYDIREFTSLLDTMPPIIDRCIRTLEAHESNVQSRVIVSTEDSRTSFILLQYEAIQPLLTPLNRLLKIKHEDGFYNLGESELMRPVVEIVRKIIEHFDNTTNSYVDSYSGRQNRANPPVHPQVKNIDISNYDECSANKTGIRQLFSILNNLEGIIENQVNEELRTRRQNRRQPTMNSSVRPSNTTHQPQASENSNKILRTVQFRYLSKLLAALGINAIRDSAILRNATWVNFVADGIILNLRAILIPGPSLLFSLFQNDFAELFDNLENWSEFLGSVYRDTSHGVGYYAVKSHSLSHVKIFPELEVELNEVTGYTQHRQQQAERRQMPAQRQT